MKEPKIRFNEFKGEWKTPFIDEVFELRNGYTPSKAIDAFWKGGTIPWFRMEDIRENGGILKDAIQHVTPLGIKGNGLFEKNSIILSTTATIGVHAMLIADSLANQQFTNFSIRKSLKNSYDPMFVYYSFFGIDEWSKKNTNSGGLLSVNIPFLLKQPFFTPSLAEQHSIASFFTTLDAQISASTSRLASLKQIKAASLQAMFPQEGETVPKLRFKGFEGEWEKLSFNTLFTKVNDANHNVSSDNYNPYGKYPIIDQSKDFIVGYTDSVLPIDHEKPIIVFGDHTRELKYVDFPFCTGADGTQLLCLKDNTTNSKYAYYLCTSIKIPNTGYNRHFKYLKESDFYVPVLAEQCAIASFFTNLDRQITLQSQRLEKLKQIKAACLDKMFV